MVDKEMNIVEVSELESGSGQLNQELAVDYRTEVVDAIADAGTWVAGILDCLVQTFELRSG